jgi:probable phosphoglycerate mutase
MTTILLIRHGETEWNRNGRWQGHADIPLSAAGRAQAQALAQRLRQEGARFDHLYASDLSRALETAQIIGQELGQPVHPFRALREVDVGSWSGLTRDEIVDRVPGAFTTVFHSSDGESQEIFTRRVGEGLLNLVQRHPGERLAIVTHGGTIRAMLRYLYTLQGMAEAPPAQIGNTSITEIQLEGTAWRIARFNDITHLPGDQAPDMLAPQNESTTVSS